MTKGDFIELVKKIETTYPEGSEKVMTLAQAFREEGMEVGLISRLTGLSKKEIEAITREMDA